MSVEEGEKKLYKYLLSKKNKKELKKIYKNNTTLSKDKLIEKIMNDLPSSEVFSGSLFGSLEWYEKILMHALKDGDKKRSEILNSKGYEVFFNELNYSENDRESKKLYKWGTKSLRKGDIITLEGVTYHIDDDVKEYLEDEDFTFTFYNLKKQIENSDKGQEFLGFSHAIKTGSKKVILSEKTKNGIIRLVLVIGILGVSFWGISVLFSPSKLSRSETESQIRELDYEITTVRQEIADTNNDYLYGYIIKTVYEEYMRQYRTEVSEIWDECDELQDKAHPDFEKCLKMYDFGLSSMYMMCQKLINEDYNEAADLAEEAALLFEGGKEVLEEIT